MLHLCRAFGWLALFVLGVASCSLATNADSFVDGKCSAGTKACGSKCVPYDDPSFGCSRPGCTACELANAVSICSPTETCAIGTCGGGFLDCNSSAGDGCEVDTAHDAMNCGGCGCRCGTGDATGCSPGQPVLPISNGTPGCVAGRCTTGLCNPGWGDCNNDPKDGCETAMNTDSDCGACGVACASTEACACALLDGRTDCTCGVPDASSAPDGSSAAN